MVRTKYFIKHTGADCKIQIHIKDILQYSKNIVDVLEYSFVCAGGCKRFFKKNKTHLKFWSDVKKISSHFLFPFYLLILLSAHVCQVQRTF